MPAYTLHLGDCLEVMPEIPTGSIDAIIADWPYGTTACKWDSVIPLEPLWKECKRVIKKNGAIVLTASQPFTSVLVMSNLAWFRYDWLWDKRSPTGYLNVKKRPMVQHESILIFSEGREAYTPQLRQSVTKPFGKTGSRNNRTYGAANDKINDSVGYPLSILAYPKPNNLSGGGLHPTQKPVALMEYLIRTYTNPGDLILDNTMGSGSTGEACLRTGRRFIGIEKDKGYFEIAQNRLKRVEQELREAQIARERQPYLMETVSQCP